jgi:glycerophosphoryl diester phosphodiesterase
VTTARSWSCGGSDPSEMNLRAAGRPLRIGHKGAAALEPENTLRSLQRAVALGCDLVEFDVLDLEDGTLVLAHSDDLLEVSHGAARGRVRRLALAELREIAPELPTLDEALELLGRVNGVGLHVDLKCPGYEQATVDAIRRHRLLERTVVSSVYAPSLCRLAALESRLSLGYTYPFDRRGLSQRRLLAPVTAATLLGLRRALPMRITRMLERACASAAMLHHWVISRAAVERAHAHGAAVYAWTVDDEPSLERVVAAGVDGVITNDPRIFRD